MGSAITQERELDKQFATQAAPVYGINLGGPSYRKSWKYDSDDEEYYAYCLSLAEKLDNKKITFIEFDYLRIQKLNDIERARSMVQSSEAAASAAAEASRSKTCTSSRDITGTVTTKCR